LRRPDHGTGRSSGLNPIVLRKFRGRLATPA
jgi:hypothetical protein